MRAAVKEPDDLGVAIDGHGRDGPFGREFEEFEAHLLGEGTAAGVHQPLHQFRVEIVGDDGHRLLPGGLRGVGGRG
jgi:hypothetical protein